LQAHPFCKQNGTAKEPPDYIDKGPHQLLTPIITCIVKNEKGGPSLCHHFAFILQAISFCKQNEELKKGV
jgi:hypothetical protein